MQNFCTLFNSFYLSRGLAMYNSLLRQNINFHLYIFAFDEACFQLLRELNLTKATIIPLSDFETPELLSVKPGRSAGEYCWTCTSFTIWHCIHTYSLDHCTYLDADLLFFADPKILPDEMGEKSVLITRHNYSPEYDQTALSGIYCVQFVAFKNTPQGLTVLKWWMEACLDWCYARFEDGKFGDQKYLDDWTERFDGVHVLENPGGGIAPWNAKDYNFLTDKNGIRITAASGESSQLVFYHYHDFRYCVNKTFRLTAEQYALGNDVIKLVYAPYLHMLQEATDQILAINPSAVYHENPMLLKWVKVSFSRHLQYLLKGYYKNYVKKSALI